MATRNFRAGKNFYSAATTRYITVNSSLATLVTMSTGYTAISMFNQGSSPLVWGSSSVGVNSGNYLFPYGRIEWPDVNDHFSFYVVSDSNGVSGLAQITEYK